jgi:ferredoxin-NADP reductase
MHCGFSACMTQVQVIDTVAETHDSFTLVVEKPQGFRFEAGQFIHIQVPVDERPLRRSYTIASAPHEEHLHIGIRIQEHGKVSPVLAKLRAGDFIDIFGPFGEFTRSDEKCSVCIAAGSGITPFRSFLRDQQHSHDTRRFVLLYSNKTAADMMYADELRSVDETWYSYTPTLTRDSWDGREGRFGVEDITEYLETAVFYLCGSNDFVRAFTTVLSEHGVSPERIRVENYGNIVA